jgi:hypothetical protein
MKDTTILKSVVLVGITLVLLFNYVDRAEAGGPWSNQYCDVETTTIRVVDANGVVLEERTEEKVTCNDGAKDFLHGMGIADNCEIFTWHMPLGETFIEQRDIACHRLDGGYEIVPGYHPVE